MKSLLDFLRKQIFPIPNFFFVKMKKNGPKVDFLVASDQLIFQKKYFASFKFHQKDFTRLKNILSLPCSN